MSLHQTIETHWEELARKRESVAEALSWSPCGRNLRKESMALSRSEEMACVIEALADERGNPIDRYKISQYFALALENDPYNNLPRFVEYLEGLAVKSNSQRRAEYYRNAHDAIMDLTYSSTLEAYFRLYEEFLRDASKESTLARIVIDEIGATAQKVMGEYS